MNELHTIWCMYFASVLLNVSPMKIRFLIHLFTPKMRGGGPVVGVGGWYDKDGPLKSSSFSLSTSLVRMPRCMPKDRFPNFFISVSPLLIFVSAVLGKRTPGAWISPSLSRATYLTFSFKPEGKWRERHEGRKTRKPFFCSRRLLARYLTESQNCFYNKSRWV